mgnify:FL=1
MFETGYDSGDEAELNKNASMDVFRDVVKPSYSKVVESHSFSTKKHLSANRSGNHIDVETYSGLRIRYNKMEYLKSWIKLYLDSCITALSWHFSPWFCFRDRVVSGASSSNLLSDLRFVPLQGIR